MDGLDCEPWLRLNGEGVETLINFFLHKKWKQFTNGKLVTLAVDLFP